MRLFVRLQQPTFFDGYALHYANLSGTDQVYLERFANGGVTTLATFPQEILAGDKLRLRVVGSTLEAWRYSLGAWWLIGQTTDSAYLGVGYVALGIRGTEVRGDDFGASSLREPVPDTTPVIDSFNRANENPLSDSGKWANLGGSYPLEVVSNQVKSWNSTAQAWRQNVRYGLDQEAWITIEAKPYSDSSNWLRLYVRLQMPTVQDGYALLYRTTSGLDQVVLERLTNGAATTLATFSREVLMGDRLKVRAVGSQIEAWHYDNNTGAWTMLGAAPDSTYLGVGYVALGIRGTEVRADNFGAATLREPVPDTTPVIDSFNRANENPLSDSGKWANLGGSYPLEVVSNQVKSWNSTAQAWRQDVRYGIDQEAWITVEAKPYSDSSNWVRLFVRLQQPTAFNGYALRYSTLSGTDRVYLERITGGGVTTLATFNQEILLGDRLRIRAIGSTLEAWRYDNNADAWVKLGQAVDSTYLLDGYLGLGIRGTEVRADNFGGRNAVPSLDPEALLNRYSPELRYDILDTFRADSAAIMTDNFQPTYSNTLIVPSVGFLAQADPDLPEDDLSLDYLGLFYPQGGISQGRMSGGEDYIEAGDSHEADAERMQGDPDYADKMYARAVPEQGGGWTLQYWLFYYFNWHPIYPYVGDHEGDWEMVQVQVDAFGIPSRAVYAQHGTGEDCAWDFVEKNASGRPVVYVARGSHASFFRAGDKPPLPPDLPGDYAYGGFPPITPAIARVDSPAPGWLGWAGHWGEEGPHGPQYQGAKWISPSYWADSISSCWEAYIARRSTESPALAAPPAPRIVATRVGTRVRVAYSFSVWPADRNRRPVTLVTTVRGSGRRDTPLLDRRRITARKGSYYRPLGLGKPPYKLFAAAYSRGGRSSATVTVRVRGG